MKQSIRTEIHTLLNNELKALKETLESLERIEVHKLPAHCKEGLQMCIHSRLSYMWNMCQYLCEHPLYKGNTKALSNKADKIQALEVMINRRLSQSDILHIPNNTLN